MFKPIHYALTLEPDLTAGTFKGSVEIDIKIQKRLSEIHLDASYDLQINDCFLKVDSEENVRLKFLHKKNDNTLLVKIPRSASREIQLSIDYQGKLNDSLTGFYRSSYTDKGKRKYLATTQFEAAEAKRAFPCVDNPSYKATFDVAMIVQNNHKAISNTLPTREEALPGGKKLVEFNTTPLMSTYLLYLGVGDWEILEKKYGDLVIRGITVSGKSVHTRFAIEWTKKCLEFYSSYFGHPYPLKKLDLIAVPDFAAGAMENWGAITFRENALLYYEDMSSVATKQRVAEVVAHELVHQWFGNLVTMKWWDDLWLNESFATYMAYKAIHRYFPEWNIWSDYVSYAYFGGMALDSLKSSHPIKVEVKRVEDIDELFDEIAYEKGGSVLRMLDEYLGESVFKKGLQIYIKKFAYKNAEAKNLWESLESVSRAPVVSVIQKFLNKTGFPVISVDYKEKKLQLSQERFLFLGSKSGEVWDTPLVIKTKSEKIRTHLFSTKKETLSLLTDGQVYINHDYAGFFITSYGSYLLKKLGESRKTLSIINKIGLLHDLFSLTLGLQHERSALLIFIENYFMDETDPETLSYINGKLTGLYLLTSDENMKRLILHFSKKAIAITGTTPKKRENVKLTSLRNGALSTLSFFDDEETYRFIKNKFNSYLKDKKPIEPDLKGVIYSAMMWHDSANYDTFLKLYRSTNIIEEQAKILVAIANVKNAKLVKKALNFALTDEVRFANVFYPILSASHNPYGKTVAYDWIVEQWDELKRRTGGHANTILRRMLKMIVPTGAIGREKSAHSFLKTHPVAGLEKTYEQIVEELEIYSRFMKRYG